MLGEVVAQANHSDTLVPADAGYPRYEVEYVPSFLGQNSVSNRLAIRRSATHRPRAANCCCASPRHYSRGYRCGIATSSEERW
jgi:hypothetical protein